MSGSNPLAAALGQVGSTNPLQFASGYADLATKAQALKANQFQLGQAQLQPGYSAIRMLAATNSNPSDDDVNAALGAAARQPNANVDPIVQDYTAWRARGGTAADFVRSRATGGMSPENQYGATVGALGQRDTGAGIVTGLVGGPASTTPGKFTPGSFIQSTLSPQAATDMVPVGQNPDGSIKYAPRWQVSGSGAPGVGPAGVGAATGVGPAGNVGPATGAGTGVSPGQAVNNFGNIRAPGGGFASYATPQDGVAAMASNLTAYQDQHGINTLNGITARWAPQGDGANNPAAYARTISQLTGIDPNAPLDLHDPATLAKIIPAMAQVEHGRPMGVGNDVLMAGINAATGPGGAQRGPFIGATAAQPVAGPGANVRPAGGVQMFDPYGRPIQGGGQGAPPVGGYGGYTTLPAGTVESLGAAAKASTDQYSADNAAAGQFQQRVWPLVQAANILDKNAPTTGQGAEAVRSIIGHLQTLGNIFSGGEIQNIGQSHFEELGKYMQQAVNASPFAASSNDKLAAAITGSPNTHMTNLANQDVLKAMIGLERMKQMAITDFNNQGGQPKDWTNFLRQWQTSHDPRAFIFDMLTNEKRQQLAESMKSPAERINFANTLELVRNNPGVMIRPSMPQ